MRLLPSLFRRSPPEAYGYPIDEAADVAIRAIAEVIPETTHVNLVRLVLFDTADLTTYIQAAERLSHGPLLKSVSFEQKA